MTDETTGPQSPLERVEEAVSSIGRFDAEASAAVARALDGKVKPLRSLGDLEHLAARLAGIQGTAEPHVDAPALVVCAADHGVAADGVSAYPQEVTALMLQSFAEGTSAVGVLARQAGARLVVADLGVAEAPRLQPGQNQVLDRRVRAGTADSAAGPAMSLAEAQQAVAHGVALVDDLVDEGVDLVGLGEMGIGNTTTASALTAVLLDRDPARLVGPGTGVTGEAFARKLRKVDAILARHRDADDPWDVLARVGGLEIAALAGVVLGCAARRVPVVLDGFITTAAALVAWRLAPACTDVMVAGHLSPEPGHQVQLQALGLRPVLDLRMRLGEGSGAALAIPVLRSAVTVLHEMGSFADLGLDDERPTA
ncbi:nicotinate-nucleotide--dimethylbenzimidazole phosphoribosyltransferase [Ornithinimicrobium pekingense]|uniref:Nicotinate-nucleotide--dimethylbenzimidazole phosphoribosyltransferase n=1 Tax=Ornithinimicrobium pekingense TaxID=384677 RepID=A0ABQ2FA05_9MICO|nr:nicotinate-nucleotide--dimethylbenzimidazole phosphoribosyltransferase [Ornithinimicrobium pekingense]GGK72992.1 nicotinate-nucleotide--dimethylbenzimidazole phosphoribosyltransferase [Ornithinimicrobium pekingense]